jgi:hypothetical protein
MTIRWGPAPLDIASLPSYSSDVSSGVGEILSRTIRLAAGSANALYWAFALSVLCGFQVQPVRGAAPQLRVAVDANFDTVVAMPGYAPARTEPDTTSPARPYTFWWNSDQDDREYYETAPIKKINSWDNVVNSLRDLEDLARLRIRPNAAARKRWRETAAAVA